jgi:hypothetical protein
MFFLRALRGEKKCVTQVSSFMGMTLTPGDTSLRQGTALAL